MNRVEAIVLHAAHAGSGFPGWLLLLPVLPAVVVGLVRLGGWLWPRVRSGLNPRGEPL